MDADVVWAIKDWDEVFETRHSRSEAGPRRYLLIPTDRQSESYVSLMGSTGGQAAYGLFVGLCRIAARCPKRGVLADEKGPYTPRRIAEKLRASVASVNRSIEMLSSPSIGWLRRTRAGHAPVTAPVTAPDTRRESAGCAPGKVGDSGLGTETGTETKPPYPPPSGGSGGAEVSPAGGYRPRRSPRADRRAAKLAAASEAAERVRAEEAEKAQKASVWHG
ncbi:MAG: hypothetical protein QG602_2123 [Verrucomicrobiota bacterium]|nr:hypothetical protein [Verrucomicrobiota bacterium]